MQMVRTTLRLEKRLKKEAERLALENEKTFQDLYNEALSTYLKTRAKKEAQKTIKFYAQNIGEPLDNLTRDSYYDDPNTKQ